MGLGFVCVEGWVGVGVEGGGIFCLAPGQRCENLLNILES